MSPKKVLISTIGSRGEVQPILGLALELQALGHEAVLCVPPTFKEWVEANGLKHVSLGPDVKQFVGASAPTQKRKPPSKEMMRKMVRASVIEQFKVTAEAAQECDLILTTGDIQHAGKSIAESRTIPHVHATYCPVTLRSWANTPPNLFMTTRSQSLPGIVRWLLWQWSDARWDALYLDAVNEQRATLKQAPVRSAARYVASERSWVAADPFIAPAAKYEGKTLFQTGAWFFRDTLPLPDELAAFLRKGPPPIYFGVGSMKPGDQTARIMIESARALGHRILLSQGWGNLSLIDAHEDSFSVGDVSHELLFPHVSAIVHHGGAGTTTAAARAGKPQVIVPHMYDQFYFADRVRRLKIGASAGHVKELSVERLTQALRKSLSSDVIANAIQASKQVMQNGAQIAAKTLVDIAINPSSLAIP